MSGYYQNGCLIFIHFEPAGADVLDGGAVRRYAGKQSTGPARVTAGDHHQHVPRSLPGPHHRGPAPRTQAPGEPLLREGRGGGGYHWYQLIPPHHGPGLRHRVSDYLGGGGEVPRHHGPSPWPRHRQSDYLGRVGGGLGSTTGTSWYHATTALHPGLRHRVSD